LIRESFYILKNIVIDYLLGQKLCWKFLDKWYWTMA